MLIEQIIEFDERGPGPPGRICTSTTSYFHDTKKQKSLRNIIEWIILLFDDKILQEALTKFNTKMQDFKRVLNLNCK